MRSIIVTGGANGIGAAICREAARRGARVGVLDIDAGGAERLAAELADAVPLVAAVNDEPAVLRAFETFGETPDVVVNNAGIVRFGPLAELSVEDWRATVDVNLTGTFIVSRTAAVRMAERGSGSIVNLTSINGISPGPYAGAYGSTKAAIALLTQQLAIEFGPAGVRVNAVAPGLIDGGMSAPIYADPEVRAARESKVPLGRLGTCEDIASVVLWLASDEAAYVTGQNLVADGGVVMSIIANLPRPRSVDSVGSGDD
jgi:NAD(P)-dependent dehydrogenase (short-subunit alcohol dehydrogenase family)